MLCQEIHVVIIIPSEITLLYPIVNVHAVVSNRTFNCVGMIEPIINYRRGEYFLRYPVPICRKSGSAQSSDRVGHMCACNCLPLLHF